MLSGDNLQTPEWRFLDPYVALYWSFWSIAGEGGGLKRQLRCRLYYNKNSLVGKWCKCHPRNFFACAEICQHKHDYFRIFQEIFWSSWLYGNLQSKSQKNKRKLSLKFCRIVDTFLTVQKFSQQINDMKMIFSLISKKIALLLWIVAIKFMCSFAEIPHPKNIHFRKFWDFLVVWPQCHSEIDHRTGQDSAMQFSAVQCSAV